MRFLETKLLTDENISPPVVAFLRQKGVNILDVKEAGLQGATDETGIGPETIHFAFMYQGGNE